MRRVFVDSNILIDVFASREPFYKAARELLVFARMGDYELWTSTAQLPTLAYVASAGKRSMSEPARKALASLHETVRFCGVNERQAEAALTAGWEDFEDALVYQAAAGIGADVLVTRNKRDFERSAIPVMDADEFFAWMYAELGIGYAEDLDGSLRVAGKREPV